MHIFSAREKIVGTTLESGAGRYLFCWRGRMEKHLAKGTVLEQTGITSLPELHQYLKTQATQRSFIHGSGKRKSEEQQKWGKLSALSKRWEGYESSLAVMGESRNSYSKTDPDTIFMRLKEDHMKNGQLKPVYNVQIAVNSEYNTGIDAFPDRTDSRTMSKKRPAKF